MSRVVYDYGVYFIGYAFKECAANGKWWSQKNKTESFTHYHMCNDHQKIKVSLFY